MVRAIIFASALMISGAALAQDAPPADAAPAAAPAADAATYPPCSAKVQDHCIQGQHGGAAHKSAKHHSAHHKG